MAATIIITRLSTTTIPNNPLKKSSISDNCTFSFKTHSTSNKRKDQFLRIILQNSCDLFVDVDNSFNIDELRKKPIGNDPQFGDREVAKSINFLLHEYKHLDRKHNSRPPL